MTPFIKSPDAGFNSCMASALRARRAQVGMTFDDLVEATGIPQISLVRIFNEKRTINFGQVAVLAEAMDTSVQEIVEEAERESIRRHGTPFGYAPDFSNMAAHDPGYSPEDEQEQTHEP